MSIARLDSFPSSIEAYQQIPTSKVANRVGSAVTGACFCWDLEFLRYVAAVAFFVVAFLLGEWSKHIKMSCHSTSSHLQGNHAITKNGNTIEMKHLEICDQNKIRLDWIG